MIIFQKKPLILTIFLIAVLGLGVVTILVIGQDSKSYVVFSDSMLPNLNTGDIVLVAKEDRSNSSFANLKIGNIIVFNPPSRTTQDNELARAIVHRVVGIDIDSNGARVIRTKGDANPQSIQGLDFPITNENYIGKVTRTIPFLGILLMYFDIIIRVLIQPLLYIIIGAIIAVILLLELRKRRVFLRNLNEGFMNLKKQIFPPYQKRKGV